MKTEFLSLSSILSLSLREIRNRFFYLFLLASVGPVTSWLAQGIREGFDPLQSSASGVSFSGLLVLLFSILVSTWGLIALVLFVCKRADSFAGVFWLALKRLPRFIAGMFLYTALIGIYVLVSLLLVGLSGFIFGFQGGLGGLFTGLLFMISLAGLVALSVYCILFPYVLILTDIPIWWTLPAAYTLVKNHFWKTLALVLILGLIGGGIYILSVIALAVVGLAIWWLIPVSRYIFAFLFVVPMALVMLSNQIPLIAVYVNRLPILRASLDKFPSHKGPSEN